MSLETIPRVALANLPTPLQEVPRLSAALDGPRILIKRDDLTGLALGGNKFRKLEFAMAEAKEKGADVVITTGGWQSNHATETAAAAAKLGMETYLVLFKGTHPEHQGNRLLCDLYGAEVEIFGDSLADQPEAMKRAEELATELRAKDRNPYVLPLGAETPAGNAGYVPAVSEICDQLRERGTSAQYLVISVGNGGTMAGLVLGAKYFKAPFQVIGISIVFKQDVVSRQIANKANQTAKLLEMDLTFDPEELTIYDDYRGEGHGIATKEGIEAIRLVARTEGIILDPLYTGKTMAGLIDLIRKGKFTAKDTVIFVHTGGIPAVFLHNKELSA